MSKLQNKRKEAGLSQSQLADKSGVPVRMIRAYEAEEASAHRDINKAEALRVYKLAEALGCGISDILEVET